MSAALRRSKEIWNELADESLEAWKIARILDVMEEKMNLAFAGVVANGLSAFEPQDEKQSAAMTLGLLSSGMTPSGSASFSDQVRMAETPLTSGGLGTTSAAVPPFNNMLYQMPDFSSTMNLDWVSLHESLL